MLTGASNNLAPSLSKRDVYIKVFKQEFLHEFHYIWELAGGRANARDNFTTKLANQLKNVASNLPVLGNAIDKFADVVEFVVSNTRMEKTQLFAGMINQLHLGRLEVLLDTVAREAYRRYEHFIIDYLVDDVTVGVIPFARVGVRRILEKLSRSQQEDLKSTTTKKSSQVTPNASFSDGVILNEAMLLAGLVEGRSGGFIDDYTNTKVPLKFTKKNKLGQKKIAAIDVENVYARPGFFALDIIQGKPTPTFYTRKEARHRQIDNLSKLKDIFVGDVESLYDFGRVKFRKSHKQDPKAGFVLMPLSVIRDRYDYQPHDMTLVSPELKKICEQITFSVLRIDKEMVENYLVALKQRPKLSLIEFVRTATRLTTLTHVSCHEDLTSVSLKGANFTDVDLSGATLSGDLSNVNFHRAYCVGMILSNITSLVGASFREAKCQCLQTSGENGVNFRGADCTQTNFSYANLQRATLLDCETLGATWIETDLTDTLTEEVIKVEQDSQSQQLQASLLHHHKLLLDLNQTLYEKTKVLTQAQQTFSAQLKSLDDTTQAKFKDVQSQLQILTEQQISRCHFEDLCNNEFKTIKTKLKHAAKKEEVEALKRDLQTTQEQLKTLQSSKEFTQNLETFKSEIQAQVQKITQNQTQLKNMLETYEADYTKVLQESLHQQEKRFQDLTSKVDALLCLEKRVDDIETGINQACSRLAHLERITLFSKQQPEPVPDQLVSSFLKHVADGEQDKAEPMLNQTPELAKFSFNVTDLSGRTFKCITAFQYAVWALDWHMWTMIRPYLSAEEAYEQAQGLQTGAWVKEHGSSASWQNLLNALEKSIDLFKKSRWEEARSQWITDVGEAQRLLPAHVVNEFCYPGRSFEPCPNFNTDTLPRSRKTNAGEWFTANNRRGRLGDGFAFFRYNESIPIAYSPSFLSPYRRLVRYIKFPAPDPTIIIIPPEVRIPKKLQGDLRSCSTLLDTRIQQRDQLLAELISRPRAYKVKR